MAYRDERDILNANFFDPNKNTGEFVRDFMVSRTKELDKHKDLCDDIKALEAQKDTQ